jgi:outer membrane protein assembly factor BamA
VFSQKAYKISFSNEEYKLVKKNPTVSFKDSISALTYIKELQYFSIKRGFLMASIDSLHYAEKTFHIHFFVGQKFKKAKINIEPDEMNFLKRNGNLNEKYIRKIDFNIKEISELIIQIHKVYENNGYPFSTIYLDKIDINGSSLEADLVVKRNAVFRFTKINLVGNPVVSLKLISSYIQIKEGDIFNQNKINEISSKIRLINFIDEVKPAELLFTLEGVELFLYLRAKPVSLINGVVGLQPDPVKNKVFLTGELRLKLVNILKKAEYFDLTWRSIQAQTQSLKAQGLFPNLFQTSFGLDGQFQLYKRDSTFLELKSTIGIQYALKQGNFLKAFYRRYSSNVLASGFNNANFANLKSVETNFYGLALSKQNLDYLPSPRKGVLFNLEGTIGLRKSQENLVVLNENTYRFELNAQYYFPLAKRHILKIANFSEVYFAPSFFQNEVYRFGGQISLRGFNEEELYATSRSVSTLEYRFLLDKDSYLFAFYDQAWYENKSSKFVTDTPFGFGAGFAFGTNIGNFSVSYAIGKQFDNQVVLRDGKVHFGYIAYF